MCRHYSVNCSNCPLCGKDCGLVTDVPIKEMDEMNKIILKWCKEHPVKTRQDKFLEMFPNVRMCCGAIDICPSVLGYRQVNCAGKDCIKCKKTYWLAKEVSKDERA